MLEMAARLAEESQYDYAATIAARAKGGKIAELAELNRRAVEDYEKYSKAARDQRILPPPSP